jgi:hypothetical protein
MTPVVVKPRKRAGSYESFIRRYLPLEEQGDLIRDWRNSEILAAFDRGRENGHRFVWSLVEGESGRCYLVPGFATVNYLGRVLCSYPWSDIEEMNPGYAW